MTRPVRLRKLRRLASVDFSDRTWANFDKNTQVSCEESTRNTCFSEKVAATNWEKASLFPQAKVSQPVHIIPAYIDPPSIRSMHVRHPLWESQRTSFGSLDA
ncbi:MAG: hypothetical protein AAF724_08390 [Pseudomonadota bacterium]